MNLTFLTKTDKQLHAMRFQQDSDGKLARKEITRRKLVGYCDGTNIQTVDAKAPIIEPESTVGTSPDRVYAAGVRRTRQWQNEEPQQKQIRFETLDGYGTTQYEN